MAAKKRRVKRVAPKLSFDARVRWLERLPEARLILFGGRGNLDRVIETSVAHKFGLLCPCVCTRCSPILRLLNPDEEAAYRLSGVVPAI